MVRLRLGIWGRKITEKKYHYDLSDINIDHLAELLFVGVSTEVTLLSSVHIVCFGSHPVPPTLKESGVMLSFSEWSIYLNDSEFFSW